MADSQPTDAAQSPQLNTFSQEHRRKLSLAAKARCTPEWRAAKSAAYSTPIDGQRLRELYESGMSQVEVAAELGVSQKVVWKAMKRFGIKTRPQVKRNQSGSNNASWRGDDASYAAMHKRVEVLKGKPACCEVCGTTDLSRTYDWANLTGNYQDTNDYKRMCRSCHWKYDKKILNIKKMKELAGEQGR